MNLSVLLNKFLVRRSKQGFLQKSHLAGARIDCSEDRISTQNVFLVDLRVKHSHFQRGRTVFLLRAQLVGSCLAYFPAVSQHWKHKLGTNWTFSVQDKLYLSTKTVVWTGCSLVVCGIPTQHIIMWGILRWAHIKEIQAQCFLQNSHLLAPRTECIEDRINTQRVFLSGFESETF